MFLRKFKLPLIVLIGALGIGSASGESGVSPDRIVFGQSAALGGPAAALGVGMKLGIEAAFAEVNTAGGVGGRTLELISLDDGYEPDRAIRNTKALIYDREVFALIGAVGTPTSKAAQPIATDAGVPYVGPFTGAEFLRGENMKNVVNFRASYFQETETWIEHLTVDLGYERIAILYQDDSFGRAGLNGVKAAMAKRNMELVAEGTYKRNTTAVKSAVLKIRKAKPQAVVMVGAYKPISVFILTARKLKFEPTFVNISFVGSAALAKELGDQGEGVVVTQVVPFPWNNNDPLVAEYQSALAKIDANAQPDFVSFEGYIVGRMAIEGLKRVKGLLTRKTFLSAYRAGMNVDLHGLALSFGGADNQGSDKVFLSVIQPDGKFAAVDRLSPPS